MDLFKKYIVDECDFDKDEFNKDLNIAMSNGPINKIDFYTIYNAFDDIPKFNLTCNIGESTIYYKDVNDVVVINVSSIFDLDDCVLRIIDRNFYINKSLYCKYEDLSYLREEFPYSHFPEYSLFNYIYHINDWYFIMNFLFVKMLSVFDKKYFKYGCQQREEYINRLNKVYLKFLKNYYPKFDRLSFFKEFDDKKIFMTFCYKLYIIMRNYVNAKMKEIARDLLSIQGEVIIYEDQEKLAYLMDYASYHNYQKEEYLNRFR